MTIFFSVSLILTACENCAPLLWSQTDTLYFHLSKFDSNTKSNYAPFINVIISLFCRNNGVFYMDMGIRGVPTGIKSQVKFF